MKFNSSPDNDLNTLCQRLKKKCSWNVTCQNPHTHMAVHLAICYSKSRFTSMMVIRLTCSVVNGIEYGRADGESEAEAKNAAARVALTQLRQEVQASNSSTSPP